MAYVLMIHPGVEPGSQEPESCVRSITLADHNYSIIAYLTGNSKKVSSPISNVTCPASKSFKVT